MHACMHACMYVRTCMHMRACLHFVLGLGLVNTGTIKSPQGDNPQLQLLTIKPRC